MYWQFFPLTTICSSCFVYIWFFTAHHSFLPVLFANLGLPLVHCKVTIWGTEGSNLCLETCPLAFRKSCWILLHRPSFSEPPLHMCVCFNTCPRTWTQVHTYNSFFLFLLPYVCLWKFCLFFKNFCPSWCVYTLQSIGTPFSPRLIYTLCRRLLIMATMCDRSKLFIITSMNSSSFLAPSTNSSRESSPVSGTNRRPQNHADPHLNSKKKYSNLTLGTTWYTYTVLKHQEAWESF